MRNILKSDRKVKLNLFKLNDKGKKVWMLNPYLKLKGGE